LAKVGPKGLTQDQIREVVSLQERPTPR